MATQSGVSSRLGWPIPANGMVLLLAVLALLAACADEAVPPDPVAVATEPVAEAGQVVTPPSTTPAGPPSMVAPTPAVTPEPVYEYLSHEVPPCTPVEGAVVDPCEQDVGMIITGTGSRDSGLYEPYSIRYFLDGWSGRGFAVGHVAVRATYLPNSVRCEAKRTMRIPGWVNISDLAIDSGIGIIVCFADIRANAYLVGSGPSTMTVMIARINYWEDTVDDAAIPAEVRGVESALRTGTRVPYTIDVPAGGIEGREVVLFLSPAIDHSFEVWQASTTWRVQRNDDDSVVVRHPNAELWLDTAYHSQAEMPLATFITSVQAAHTARMTEYDGKITKDFQSTDNDDLPTLVTDANMLNSYHVEVENTTHADRPAGCASTCLRPVPCRTTSTTQAWSPTARHCWGSRMSCGGRAR